MTTITIPKSVAIYTGADVPDLTHPVSVNIKPILDSIAGKLTDDEIDQWFVGFEQVNEGRGFTLELTAEGELVIAPMVNSAGLTAEGEFFVRLFLWNEYDEAGAQLTAPTPICGCLMVLASGPTPCGCRRSR